MYLKYASKDMRSEGKTRLTTDPYLKILMISIPAKHKSRPRRCAITGTPEHLEIRRKCNAADAMENGSSGRENDGA